MKLGLHIAMTNWAGGAARLGPTLHEAVEAAEAAGEVMGREVIPAVAALNAVPRAS